LSSGGLVAALSGLKKKMSFIWVGWPGTIPKEEQELFRKQLWEQQRCIPVFLDEQTADEHYNGFSNGILWPLFHYISKGSHFDSRLWASYCKANREFADVVDSIWKEGDLVWVHDYHLMLLPKYFREKRPTAAISFFLHIPFPSSEVYKVLPVRAELLIALLHCTLIGVHTYDYVRHFLLACSYLLGVETAPKGVYYKNEFVTVGAFPVGIDVLKWQELLASTEVQQRIRQLDETFSGKKIFLGVDRLDYIKGLPHKFQAFELFLRQHIEYQDKVVFIQVAVPTRQDVTEYKQLKREVDQLVGRINGRYGGVGHNPIHYLFKSVNSQELAALYSIADACIVTSIRDGMNLVCQEYVACQQKKYGVVVLSEFAGAAQCLCSALRVNPWDVQEVANAYYEVVTMSLEERRERHETNFNYISKHTASHWGLSFTKEMKQKLRLQQSLLKVTHMNIDDVVDKYKRATHRLILLEYDGVCSEFHPLPSEARPTPELLSHLKKLSSDKRNVVFIYCGREKRQLDTWFDGIDIGFFAEHGYSFKMPFTKEWKRIVNPPIDNSWMKTIRPVLDYFTIRTPGSWIEQKEANITWHYRNCPRSFGQLQAQEITNFISNITDYNIEVVRLLFSFGAIISFFPNNVVLAIGTRSLRN
jgi:trehalose 6-phosphate synthase/phosphatase